MTIPTINTKEPLTLNKCGSWPESVHLFDENSVNAIRTALAAKRPLLIRGEPGTGKSQLARAAAQALQRQFVSIVVRSGTQSQDLHWHYDAVSRLADAQAKGAGNEKINLDHKKYLSPGVFWWVFDHDNAARQFEASSYKYYRPQNSEFPAENGSVLLIDEIDKADADLPNGLLETLGNGAFSIPWDEAPIGLKEGVESPLVIITTNEDRELPSAFVRRCLVLNLEFPKTKEALCKVGEVHYGEQCTAELREKAANLLHEDRDAAAEEGVTPPGQAEYLDMLRAITTLEPEQSKQMDMLDIVSEYCLKKYPQDDD